jgi:1-acyl-sn-glycerol-3-phosphate acyltransferase
VTLPFDRRRVVLHLYSSAWATFYIHINPLWRLRTSGRELLPWNGAAVFVANHTSLVDVLALFALYRPFKWVAKDSLFRVPLVGWNMRLNGYVPLVRGSGPSVRAMLARCGSLLHAGIPVFFFPEGSRSADGRLGPFKLGAFALAVQHRVPVYPIAVWGTRDALPKHGLTLRQRARMRIQVLPPLLPSGASQRRGPVRGRPPGAGRSARERPRHRVMTGPAGCSGCPRRRGRRLCGCPRRAGRAR